MRGKKKPNIYVDTSIISAYWYRGKNVLSVGRRLLTREWWNTERKHFTLLATSVTEDELGAGRFPRQKECLRMVRKLRYLPVTGAAEELAELLLVSQIVPENKPGDALQLSLAAVHEIDYLLTWNYAHLANPVVQERLEVVCRNRKSRHPLLVSPETIPRVSLGQSIRRHRL